MKKFFILIIIFLSSYLNLFAQFEFAGNITAVSDKKGFIELKLTNALCNIYIVDKNIIRFRYVINEFSNAPSYAVTYESGGAAYTFNEDENNITIKTSELTVTVSKNPCRVKIYDNNMNIINEDEESFGAAFDNDEVRCFKKLYDNEMFFGLGEKTGNFNRRGSQYTNWNSDKPAYTKVEDPLYQSIPFFIGVREFKAYGIFFDNTYRSWFNFGASNNRFYWFGAEKGELDYYFIYGPEIKKVITSYTLLTGRIQLPPIWALGYQQSKWSYYPDSNVMEVARSFRNRNIPCDVIYLDIHHMDDYRVFTWNKDRFPEPERMLDELKELGFKVITIIDPGVKADTNYFMAKEGLQKELFAKYPDGEVFQGEVWPGWSFFPDFTNPDTREWWGEKNADWMRQGIAGIWNDMNEPALWGQSFPDIVKFNFEETGADHKRIHNVYALQMARSTYDGLKKAYPDKRHFILTRAGFSGIQRYSAVWTGDNYANEDHLVMSCTLPLSMGLSGIPFIGSDVGGFIGEPSKELYIRWLQLGAFSPFFRGHSEVNKKDQEPYAFGDRIENYAREIISLRYQLLPMFYGEFYKSSLSGLPVMRPMFLNFQSDKECYSESSQHQFMIGDNLLAAPVLNENDKFKKLYLPEGKWLDWWTNEIYEGGKWIIAEAPLNRIPLFIKEGGIIPMQEVQNYTGEKEINTIRFKIFPGSSSTYNFYEDDGSSTEYKQGIFSVTGINVKTENDGIRITTELLKDDYESSVDYFEFHINGLAVSPSRVLMNGSGLTEDNTRPNYFYSDKQQTVIRIKKGREE